MLPNGGVYLFAADDDGREVGSGDRRRNMPLSQDTNVRPRRRALHRCGDSVPSEHESTFSTKSRCSEEISSHRSVPQVYNN